MQQLYRNLEPTIDHFEYFRVLLQHIHLVLFIALYSLDLYTEFGFSEEAYHKSASGRHLLIGVRNCLLTLSEKLPLFFQPTSPLEPSILEASWIFLLLPYAMSESTGLCKMFHAANEPNELSKATFVKYHILVAMVNIQN
uniref:Uncharacterized protein n=1 Tax=Glossina pallidipes TaxID=7398 RepID=A0A1B0A001_GLOPL